MGPPIKSYLCTLWALTPKAAARILHKLNSCGLNAEFAYDSEYNIFEVTCQPGDRSKIVDLYNNISSEVEKDAFHGAPDLFLNTFSPITVPETTSINHQSPQQQSRAHSPELSHPLQKLTLLPDFAENSHIATWSTLKQVPGHMTMDQLVSEAQLNELQRDTGVVMAYGDSGRLVHISGGSDDAVERAKQKLENLLAIKRLPRAEPEHVLYIEDVETASAEPTLDTRYMARIDQRLVSSTLIDPATVRDVDKAYARLHAWGISIRLCKYDEDKRHHVSIFGPKIVPRSSKNYRLGNRPVISRKQVNRVVTTAEDDLLALNDAQCVVTPAETNLLDWNQEPDKEAQVSTWIRETQAMKPVGGTLIDDQIMNEMQAIIARGSSLPGDKKLLKALCERLLAVQEAKSVRSSESSECDFKSFSNHSSAAPSVNAQAEAKVRSVGSDEPSLNDPGCLPNLSGRPGAGHISWDMPPLVPDAVNAPSTFGSSPSSLTCPVAAETATETSGFKRFNEPGSRIFNTMDQQGGRKSRAAAGAARPNSQPSPRGPVVAARPQNFPSEIEAALGRLLKTGPYRRGKVGLRADFGRAILAGLDQSALAYNKPGQPSNGWRKGQLQDLLNSQVNERNFIHFTKILSTHAFDVEEMIGALDEVTSAPLWLPSPTDVCLIYSFQCEALDAPDVKFVVDIKDEGKDDDFSYTIRPWTQQYGPDGLMPIYVHGTQRNWDLRVMLSHSDDAGMERSFGEFARAILGSLEIPREEGNSGPRLTYAVPDHFGVLVTSLRVLTKWRYLSVDERSALDITEVEKMVVDPCHDAPPEIDGERWSTWSASPWTPEIARRMRAKGEFPWWYEASVVSPEAEELFRQNDRLRLGEKADWDAEMLKATGILASIYKPALQLLKKMDQVGANENNRHPVVDGKNADTPAVNSPAGDQVPVIMPELMMHRFDGVSGKKVANPKAAGKV
ncbi:hypothetical protein QBC46DRAFT_322499 [Diplogelasinospora grovesii]|uniref:DUF7905 domain-containing protein n=1 Tax=Diplogelasinospora grovesii TaxID=303347 RepID=A0AAN6S0W5_9PEZI|nr:hypothetical protein QBC46DRAFT_322499 [Diplogelasinospora grovesii]